MVRTLALTALVGCSGGLKDDRFATGSSTVVATHKYRALVAVNVDEGTVSRIDPEGDVVSTVEVGLEPTRIARADRDLWVTLRGEGAVAVLDGDDPALPRLATLPAGVEPYGVVASEDGQWVYVASSMTNEVLEFDARSRVQTRTFPVRGEPRWLALHPRDEALFVGSVRDGILSRIDLVDGGGGSGRSARGQQELAGRNHHAAPPDHRRHLGVGRRPDPRGADPVRRHRYLGGRRRGRGRGARPQLGLRLERPGDQPPQPGPGDPRSRSQRRPRGSLRGGVVGHVAVRLHGVLHLDRLRGQPRGAPQLPELGLLHRRGDPGHPGGQLDDAGRQADRLPRRRQGQGRGGDLRRRHHHRRWGLRAVHLRRRGRLLAAAHRADLHRHRPAGDRPARR